MTVKPTEPAAVPPVTKTSLETAEKPGLGEKVSSAAKSAADKTSETVKGAAAKVSETSKTAATKVSEGAKGAAGSISSGAKSVGETVKAHPIKTAAAVGGVAAAAAGAVVGKKMYDKRKANAAETPDVKPSAD